MYEQFYEMKHTPFTRSIPTSALHKTRQSAEVFSRLEYTARNQLFAVLIGEPGTGKTSTLRRLKAELSELEYMVLYIADSKLTPRSFYNYLLIRLGCNRNKHYGFRLRSKTPLPLSSQQATTFG